MPVVAEGEDAEKEARMSFSCEGSHSGEVRRNKGVGVQAGGGRPKLHVRPEGD